MAETGNIKPCYVMKQGIVVAECKDMKTARKGAIRRAKACGTMFAYGRSWDTDRVNVYLTHYSHQLIEVRP
jgi:hypothetical protein